MFGTLCFTNSFPGTILVSGISQILCKLNKRLQKLPTADDYKASYSAHTVSIKLFPIPADPSH